MKLNPQLAIKSERTEADWKRFFFRFEYMPSKSKMVSWSYMKSQPLKGFGGSIRAIASFCRSVVIFTIQVDQN
jgi:hypothetical protein